MRTLDHINTSYADWFSDPAYFASRRDDIVCVMRQERLADDFVVLRDRLGLPAAALPAVNVGGIRNPGGLDRDLDERARTNLAAWYADDFAYLELVDEIDPR